MRFASAAYLCRGVAGGWSPLSGSQPCGPARPTAASSVLVPEGHSANKKTQRYTRVNKYRVTFFFFFFLLLLLLLLLLFLQLSFHSVAVVLTLVSTQQLK